MTKTNRKRVGLSNGMSLSNGFILLFYVKYIIENHTYIMNFYGGYNGWLIEYPIVLLSSGLLLYLDLILKFKYCYIGYFVLSGYLLVRISLRFFADVNDGELVYSFSSLLHIIFVVHSMSIAFKRPAKFNDLLVVTSALEKIGHSSLTFNQTVSVEDQLLVQAQVKLACVSALTFKPTVIPKSVILKMESA